MSSHSEKGEKNKPPPVYQNPSPYDWIHTLIETRDISEEVLHVIISRANRINSESQEEDPPEDPTPDKN